MVIFRGNQICHSKNPFNWQVKFVGLGIFMAMLEESITTGMTNLAPSFWREKLAKPYITASTNFFDVILHHSVIVFHTLVYRLAGS